ncbi:hypothetical protein C9374_014265 [Naegleria lovaniensis]|uniref:Uncharacterized protein n=1 Tax=Naegleria lovaniensis TaxID=51637 RepID=A0AA88G8U6_NAELO|nr:uncharacterized protein C9374_014265 [Naegleria lovaniensis]KAG2370742.1 hypothetical protein C9374_014265 [Naegleria lovaniensis]
MKALLLNRLLRNKANRLHKRKIFRNTPLSSSCANASIRNFATTTMTSEMGRGGSRSDSGHERAPSTKNEHKHPQQHEQANLERRQALAKKFKQIRRSMTPQPSTKQQGATSSIETAPSKNEYDYEHHHEHHDPLSHPNLDPSMTEAPQWDSPVMDEIPSPPTHSLTMEKDWSFPGYFTQDESY